MPDVQGKLSPAEISHIHNWMAHHHRGVPTCPICRQQSWFVTDYVGQSLIFPMHTRMVSDNAFPYVAVACTVCGYTMFLSAIILGLYPTQET